ncbi:MAG: hypothetical protein M1832_004435 [Thelocarpon impressellum]|nr:MAG: hypothetical protein M1832_004435 [Thelocarpon impressellum]
MRPVSHPFVLTTEKLELPSISQVQIRGPVDVPWYNHHSAQRPLHSSTERLPALSLPHAHAGPGPSAAGPPAPRLGPLASSTAPSGRGSLSLTDADQASASAPAPATPPPPAEASSGFGAALGHGLRSPQQQPPPAHGYVAGYDHDPYGGHSSMNHAQPYMDMHHSHMSAAQHQAPQPPTSAGMSHYSQYGQGPPLLQPGPGGYSPAQSSFGQYAYANGVASPQSAGHPSSAAMVGGQVPAQLLPLPGTSPVSSADLSTDLIPTAMAPGGQPPPGPGSVPPGQGYPQQSFDTTGQIAPTGMKPRVTATLWEDEGSLCFQVEAKGVCVARREDNHMINGTKLLNVAGMTRGRRDGILKSEKMRHVVKIGPMHLKGVWIPFERALDFANKEKITELLYPLFVHNIGALLYHPTNSNRTNAVMAAAERRRTESGAQDMRNPQTSQSPSLHHHHSMHNPLGSHLSGPHSSIAPHPGVGRPGLDRAHTFPTPPTSAGIMGMGGPESSYWNGQSMGGQGTQPLAIDTGLSNARSMPTTPATTPPGNSLQSMQQYQGGQAYDASRSMYSAPPPQHGQYVTQQNVAQQNMARFGQPMQPSQYVKNEMGPPSSRAPGAGPEAEHAGESKGGDGMIAHGQGNEQVGHGPGEEEAEHEHDAEYAHDGAAGYGANRGPYGYSGTPAVGPMTGEHAHLSPEMTGSPNNQSASGRATPRTAAAPQPQWTAGYHTPPRTQSASSNLYNVMSNDQRANGSNGAGGGDGYAAQQPGLMTNGYPSQQQPIINGTSSNNKRVREIDDDGGRGSRPSSRGPGSPGDVDGLKRRKTVREDSLPGVGGAIYDRDAGRPLARARPAIVQRRR